MSKRAIVVTGLPASGKSTVGRLLANSKGIAFLDKDDFLEALFEERGVGDFAWRRKLSHESNEQFANAARRSQGSVVLVSHWRPPNDDGPSGTPTEWLNTAFGAVVEVFCDCPVDEATTRFMTRSRHPGHCDKDRRIDEVRRTFQGYAKTFPLGIGPVVQVDTAPGTDPDISRVVSTLDKMI